MTDCCWCCCCEELIYVLKRKESFVYSSLRRKMIAVSNGIRRVSAQTAVCLSSRSLLHNLLRTSKPTYHLILKIFRLKTNFLSPRPPIKMFNVIFRTAARKNKSGKIENFLFRSRVVYFRSFGGNHFSVARGKFTRKRICEKIKSKP